MAYHGQKKLYKTKDGSIIGGVCAGLSEYFKIDVTIIRVVVCLLVFGYGTGLFVYLALWALLPDKNTIV